MSKFIRESVKVGDRTVTLETGRIAKQAQGACLVSCGESIVLVTACGTTELILCIEAMRRSVVPPTLNLRDPDVAAIHLPQSPLERSLERVVTNNFAFGGINASLVLGRAPAA